MATIAAVAVTIIAAVVVAAGAAVTMKDSRADGSSLAAVSEVVATTKDSRAVGKAVAASEVEDSLLGDTRAEDRPAGDTEAAIASLEVVTTAPAKDVGVVVSFLEAFISTYISAMIFALSLPVPRIGADAVARVGESRFVTQYEDKTVAPNNGLSAAFKSLKFEVRLPYRPAYATLGVECVMYTNFFHIMEKNGANKGVDLYRYDISFIPEAQLSKPKRRNLVKQLLMESFFENTAIASDYSSILITAKKLKMEPGEGKLKDFKDFKILYHNLLAGQPGGTGPEQNAEARKRNEFKVRVQYLTSYNLTALLSYLSDDKKGASFGSKEETIQAMNIVINSGPNTTRDVALSSKNSFFPYGGPLRNEERDLGKGLVALRGYYSSVRPGPSRLLLNLNVSHAAFYKPENLRDLIERYGGSYRPLKELNAFLRHVRVTTNYAGWTAVKSVYGLTKEGNSSAKQKFLHGSKQVTVEQYFKSEYNISLRYPDALVVNCGDSNKTIYIPSELCTVIPGQLARRALSPDQTSEMIKFAARPPNYNLQSIVTNGFEMMRIGTNPQNLASLLGDFGIHVSPKLLEVPARRLNPPNVYYGGNKQLLPRDGQWNVSQVKFFRGSTIGRWASRFLYMDDRTRINDNVRSGINMFREALQGYGIQQQAYVDAQEYAVPKKSMPENAAAIDNTLKRMFDELQKNSVHFILVVLPSKDKYLYSRVKLYGDVVYGIHTVGITYANLTKLNHDTFANVAHKFNLKAGGINHMVKEDDIRPLDKTAIALGIDVTHPSPGSSEKAPSIAAVVASVDANFAHYPGSIRCQTRRKEMVEELAEMVEERLSLWKAKNGGLPKMMIVFRDGVSEGDYKNVLEKEVSAIRKAFVKLYGQKSAAHPKLSVIVVGKRHHTRFYPTKEADADLKSFNPKAGTVVDRHVTGYGDKAWDFYLQAHKGLQGTAKPGHYVVLLNEINFTANQAISMTHNLCYSFGRSTKSVSICPPAYYADLLCERGRAYLHLTLNSDSASESSGGTGTSENWTAGVHPRLEKCMFYI